MPRPASNTVPPFADLYIAALRIEDQRHARRVAELHRMKGRLRLLDAFVPALKAAGLQLLLEPMTAWEGKAIHIRTGYLPSPETTQRLLDVLLAQGMKETERRHYGTWDAVVVRKGHLRLALTVNLPRPAGADTPPATQTAAPTEAAQAA